MAEVEAELWPGARVMVALGEESTRSPEGGSTLRSAGRDVEEGNMFTRCVVLFRPALIEGRGRREGGGGGVKIDTEIGEVG